MSDEILQEILDQVQGFLEKLIDENKDNLSRDNYFEVKTSIAYKTFRLGWIEGSYNESLQGLIHHYMFEKKIYHKFLNEDELKNVTQIVKENPEYIYQPDGSENSDLIDDIYWECISFVGKKLSGMGFEVDNAFDEYLED